MAKPSPTLLGRVAGWIMPGSTTHQRVAGSEGIRTLRGIITILTVENQTNALRALPAATLSLVTMDNECRTFEYIEIS